MNIREIATAAGFVVGCELAGVVGSVFTFPQITTWYASLAKPEFSPPNWVFGPVWTTLYLLMGLAAYMVWKKGGKGAQEGLALFIGQLVLNTLWSLAFFGMRSPLYGLIVIAALWLAIAGTIWKFNEVSKTAALMMVPYILWVSFAAVLNYSIWALN
jgi:translocator protein